MAGRHGNKGVVSYRSCRRHALPFRRNSSYYHTWGTITVDIGQVMELHLGMAARTLGIPQHQSFDGVRLDFVKESRYMAMPR